ncbi:endospore germination permease [Bacillus altitudinis]|uniref:GerAB/ArcD/ProY family transporter n=1 Tax=Bacillus TaxID=1386 RepID=UPI0024A969F6|nr:MULTISPECIES: endospore germination permease [Bacillus]WHF26658.1 endospore germination permease [Bacillus altitudinis]WMT29529.1 endospore germination permease [Bacillus aerius]
MTKIELSPSQAVFFIIQSQIGVGILSLPHSLMRDMGHDGWFAILLACLFIQIFNTIFIFLSYKYPDTSFFEALTLVFGKWIGRCLIFICSLYCASIGILVLSIFTRVLNIWVLPLTPNWVISLLLIIAVIYITKESLTAIIRFNFVLTPVLLILSLLMLYALKGTNIDYLRPLFQMNHQQLGLGLKDVVLALNGFETFLLIAPNIKGSIKKRYKVMTIANLCTTLFYLFITLICFMFFSPRELNIIPYPVVYLLKTLSFGIIERTDLLFLSFWFLVVLATIVNYLYFATKGLEILIQKRKHKALVYLSALLIYASSCYLSTDTIRIEYFNEFTTIAQYSFIYFIPIVMTVIIILKRKKQVKPHAS